MKTLTPEQCERHERLMLIAQAIADPRQSLGEQAARIGQAAYRFDLQGDRWAAEILKMGTGKVSG